MVFELYWIQVVYDRFPALAAEQQRKDDERSTRISTIRLESHASLPSILRRSLNLEDWQEFVRLPVFLSSVSISLLYLTVLSYVTSFIILVILIDTHGSFEGTMLGYLKTLDFRDDFLAEMRGLCVITGLIGTLVTVPLENKLGSARAGSWSIWSVALGTLFFLFLTS
jgi:iron-regulated transporter 1